MGEMEEMVRKACVETLVWVGLKEYRDHQAHTQDASPTLAGVEQPAPPPRAPSSYTLVELEGLTVSTKEEQPTIFACQMILTISNTRVVIIVMLTWLEWSMTIMVYLLFHLSTVTMSPVLCAMWPLAVCQ